MTTVTRELVARNSAIIDAIYADNTIDDAERARQLAESVEGGPDLGYWLDELAIVRASERGLLHT